MKTLILVFTALMIVACSQNGKDGVNGTNGSDGTAGNPGVSASADDGGMTGGGGDEYVQEIALFSTALVDYLRKHPIAGVPVEDLAKAVAETKISLEDSLILSSDGKPRSAINYPDRGEIQFSREHLDKIRSEKDKIIRLIFHEFLGILKINDLPDYAVSNQLNAAELARELSLTQGTFVPTRLLTLDLAEQNLTCTDTHGTGNVQTRALDCTFKVQVEKLISYENLRLACGTKIKTDYPSEMNTDGFYNIIEYRYEQDSKNMISMKLGIRQLFTEEGLAPYVHKTNLKEVTAMLKTCKLNLLLYPDSAR